MADLSIPQKRCTKCLQEFPAIPENFYRNKYTKDGFLSQCRACSYYAKSGGKPVANRRNGDSKQCSACEQWHPATKEYFAGAKNRYDGLYPECKTCSTRKAKESARAKGIQPKQVTRQDGQKRCPKCEQWKSLTKDNWYSERSPYCVSCQAAHAKERRIEKGLPVRPERRKGDLKQCVRCEKWLTATGEFLKNSQRATMGCIITATNAIAPFVLSRYHAAKIKNEHSIMFMGNAAGRENKTYPTSSRLRITADASSILTTAALYVDVRRGYGILSQWIIGYQWRRGTNAPVQFRQTLFLSVMATAGVIIARELGMLRNGLCSSSASEKLIKY